MTTYFMILEVPGFIGFICTVLVGLYGVALSSLYTFFDNTNLHYRVAASGGLFGSIKLLFLEVFTVSKGPRRRCSCCYSFLMLLLVLFSSMIPFIVTSGIKTSMGIKYEQGPTTWSTNFTYDASDTNTPSFLLPTRGNYSEILSNLLNSIGSMQYNGIASAEAEFKVLSPATNTTICGVNINYLGPLPCDHPTPGTISLTRQLYTFAKNSTPVCEPTSDCELMIMKTTLASWADYTTLFETPWTVMYNDHEGNSIPIANISGAPGTANSYQSYFLSERPTTLLVGYPEKNGVSVMATFTTASFQSSVVEDFTFTMRAELTIGSSNPLMAPIIDALNASISTSPPIGATASNNVTVVYNTPTALSDNTTHITCVLYEVNLPQPEQTTVTVHRVSCRELRISVMLNTGAQPNPAYPHYSMVQIFNSMAPNQIDETQLKYSQYQEVGSLYRMEFLDQVAYDMAQILGNITERLYPFAAQNSAVVLGYNYVDGISFERWSLVFMATLAGIVMVIFTVDRVVNDEYARMGVVALMERTTKTAKTESFVYPRWRLINDRGTFRVLLRGQRVEVTGSPESARLRVDGHYEM